MSWRLFRHRFLAALPPQQIARAIVTRSLHETADEYVKQHLPLGALLHEATDGPVIAPFRQLIPTALARRGLRLDEIPGGWRVVRSPWPPLPPPACECAVCHASIFDCGHGMNVVVYDATAAKE